MAPVFQAAAVGAEPTGTGYVLGMDTTSHDLGAVRLHALEAGVGGAPLLLVHGFTGCKEDFAEEVDGLAELGYHVVAPDLRGHGESDQPDDEASYGLRSFADDLFALTERLGWASFDLLGHSMGGSIALRFALARPDLVRSLILMDTSGWSFVASDPAVAELMQAFFTTFDPSNGLPDTSALAGPEEALINAATPPEWQAVKEQMAAAFDPHAFKALGAELLTGESQWIRDRLREIACPVSVIVGEHDHPFVDQAEELAHEANGARLTVVPGAYHSPQLTHSAAWVTAVEAHLTNRA